MGPAGFRVEQIGATRMLDETTLMTCQVAGSNPARREAVAQWIEQENVSSLLVVVHQFQVYFYRVMRSSGECWWNYTELAVAGSNPVRCEAVAQPVRAQAMFHPSWSQDGRTPQRVTRRMQAELQPVTFDVPPNRWSPRGAFQRVCFSRVWAVPERSGIFPLVSKCFTAANACGTTSVSPSGLGSNPTARRSRRSECSAPPGRRTFSMCGGRGPGVRAGHDRRYASSFHRLARAWSRALRAIRESRP